MALKKLNDSTINNGECDFEVEEKKFDNDTQDAKEILENLVIEEKDAGIEEKPLVRDNCDDDDDEKESITEEDGAVIVAEQSSVAGATEPFPLEYTTK